MLKEVFETEEWEKAISYNDASPSLALHPSLDFITQPVRNEHFAFSVEGIRLEPGWKDDFVRDQLQKNKHLIFAFGGSTMLGHGVGSGHTLSFYMNEALKGTGRMVLNFGSQAYDQKSSIEKLVYLLAGGYRPEFVIFLDGWNDIIGMARSNLRTRDKVIYHGFVTNRGKLAFTPGSRFGNLKFLRLFLESLPAYRFLDSYGQRAMTIDNVLLGRDAFVHGFDFHEAEFVYFHWADFAERDLNLLKKQILENFSANLSFLNKLSVGFGFKLYSFYQPIGLLDSENPFVNDDARLARGYSYFTAMDQEIKKGINLGKFAMVDLSSALRVVSDHKYVDVAHYSPSANKALATEIFRRLFGNSKISQKKYKNAPNEDKNS